MPRRRYAPIVRPPDGRDAGASHGRQARGCIARASAASPSASADNSSRHSAHTATCWSSECTRVGLRRRCKNAATSSASRHGSTLIAIFIDILRGMSSSTWSKLLVDHAGQSGVDLPPLEARLDEVIRSARLAWPTVDLATERFVAHLARHLPAGAAIDVALEQMHTADLYLACACALGDRHAVQAFEQHCMRGLESVLSRYRASSDLTAEVKQRVRERALVRDAGPPRIELFSGRGDLRSWVRVMAAREAIGLLRGSRRETSVDDDELLHSLLTPADAELEHAKARYVQEFKQAFSESLRELSARDQTLLRQHVIDGLTIDQLGALYGVHRATAARNLERARKAVLAGTRRRLASVLQVRTSEIDSILRLIRSRVEVTLRWLVRRRRRG
ncbi:MAG TPA: sigma-70 family RNA polymerase sigma factor [Kofleriaceae bacterium]